MRHELDLTGYRTDVPLFTEFLFRYRDAVLAAAQPLTPSARRRAAPTREEYLNRQLENRNRKWFHVFKALGFTGIPTCRVADYLCVGRREASSKLCHFERHKVPLVKSRARGEAGCKSKVWDWIGPTY